MKKLFTLFIVTLISVSVFAAPATVPQVSDLANYGDPTSDVILCLYFDEGVCNEIVLVGTYNGWEIDVASLTHFETLTGFNGWWVASFPWEKGAEGKAIQLRSDGTLDWAFQTGDKDAWIHQGGKEATVEAGYGDEADVSYPEAGAYIYEIAYFKLHNSPCDWSGAKVGDLYYNIDPINLTAEVTHGIEALEFDTIVIPSSISYGVREYSVTSIGEEAFRYCSGLTSIEIPNSITSIGDYAFSGCSGLTSIEIPNSVTSIGSLTFSGCSGLTSIVVENENPTYDSRNNCNAIMETTTNTLITGCKNSIIPNSVTRIGNSAFYGCFGLTSIEIPNSVTSIGESAFSGCSGLTSITIPNSVTSIGYCAFQYCDGLTRVTCLGETPATLGSDVFRSCAKLSAILVPCGTIDAYKYSWNTYSSLIKYFSYQITTNVNIIEAGSVEAPLSICDSLLIAIPNDGYHFVQWSDGVTDNPRTIELTQDTTFTAKFAIDRTGTCGDDLLLTWTYDPGKKVLTISGNGTLNGNYTFGIEAPTNMQKLEIQSGVTSIGNSAFANEENITSVKLPNTLTTIGDHAFVGCKKLSAITIPEAVTSIGKAAFKNGNRLETIILGANVESIGDSAFANCPYILSVYAHMEYPPVINASVFDGDGDLSLVDLYVPESALTRYKKTAVWKEFNLQAGQEPKPEPQDVYTISYIGHESAILGSEDVTLHFPEAPEIEGFTFLGWRPVATFIESNTIVIEAVYESEGGTDLPAEVSVPANPTQKLIRQGNVYILTGDHTYTLTGQEVK